MIRPNRSHPLNQGRKGWWLQLPGLPGNSNVLADCWGSLAATSAAMPTPVAGLGPFGMAGLYNGSTQYGRAVCPTLTAFTFVAWVRFDNFTGATIVKNWATTIAGYLHWDASLAGAGVVSAYVNSDSGGGGNATASNTLSAGVAYRLAVTAGGGAIAVYCNGTSVGTSTYAGNLSSTLGYLGFGCKLGDTALAPDTGPGAAYLAGTMGDVSFWSRALSATEIAQFDAEMRAGYPNLLIRDRPTVALFQQRGRLRIGMDGGFPAYAGGF